MGNISEYAILDILIGIFLVLFLIHGFRRGLVRVAFSFAALLAGWVVASRFHLAVASRWTVSGENAEVALRVGVFVVLFLGTALVVRVVGIAANKLFAESPLGLANRILGGVLGLLVGTVFLGVLFLVVTTYFPSGHRVFQGSRFHPPLIGVVRVFAQALPEEAKNLFDRHIENKSISLPENLDDYV